MNQKLYLYFVKFFIVVGLASALIISASTFANLKDEQIKNQLIQNFRYVDRYIDYNNERYVYRFETLSIHELNDEEYETYTQSLTARIPFAVVDECLKEYSLPYCKESLLTGNGFSYTAVDGEFIHVNSVKTQILIKGKALYKDIKEMRDELREREDLGDIEFELEIE